MIPRATGCAVRADDLTKTGKDDSFDVTDFGASPGATPQENARAINAAVAHAAGRPGGGTVVIPAGRFVTYTIELRSNVNLYLSQGATLASGRYSIRDGVSDVTGEAFTADGGADAGNAGNGDGAGNSLEPEVNPYVGLQDHAHSYLRNCLIWGDHVENVMIHGPGLIDGSWVDEHGVRHTALVYSDPQDPPRRDLPGHTTEWFGNKGIALRGGAHVVLRDFRMLYGGHFAIIATDVTDLLVENLLVDSNRDGIDIDSVRDCTVRGCTFNTLHDDAIVVKSSYGAERFAPARNVLVENCTVSGYDTGSVLAGNPSSDRIMGYPGIPGIGRVKLGTEATAGYDLVTIRNIRFEHCMGLALEAVDGSDMTNVVVENLDMEDVLTCPIFIRTGDRGRFPVTGRTTEPLTEPDGDVRLDDRRWILPNLPGYDRYPVRRYIPSYNYTQAELDGGRILRVVDPADPVRLNPANWAEIDGVRHPYVWDEAAGGYRPDMDAALGDQDVKSMGNAVGADHVARAAHIEITNVRACNVDPRYPIIVAGTLDGRIEDLRMRNIDVTYRGGLSLADATEQRFVNTPWTFREWDIAPETQDLPWLVQRDNADVMPRVRFEPSAPDKPSASGKPGADGGTADSVGGSWVPDPYNVAESVRTYPEPVQFGILPAYGLYARHVDGLTVEGLALGFETEDARPAIVLDDVSGGTFAHVHAAVADGVSHVVEVTHPFKRRTGFEFVPGEPYLTTTVRDVALPGDLAVEQAVLRAPEPMTPPDERYALPTVPSLANGYRYDVPNDRKPLPRSVHLPYFLAEASPRARVGEELRLPVIVRDPLGQVGVRDVTADGLPDGASFGIVAGAGDGRETGEGTGETAELVWTPKPGDEGVHHVTLRVEAGAFAVSKTIAISVG
ncbi:glycoside hydrolase family 28 protein [Bifidobacterium avesanii]|nr:right-handed parallel beta-helix repeat-containing protein [Bifidobacterium avesanii]KAB8292825.1 Endopolygalacturonase [Bifidobacterium avesanii]